MSWLLITATPLLLMLTAAGLGRIEAGLEVGRATRWDDAATTGPKPVLPVNPQFRGTRHDNRV